MEKKKISPVLETLICAVLFFISIYLGKYIYVTYLALPFIGAYLYARQGFAWELVLCAAGAAMFLWLQKDAVVIATIMFVIPCVASGMVIKGKQRTYESVIISAAGWFLALGAAAAWIYFKEGMKPVDWIMQGITEQIKTNELFARNAYAIALTNESSSTTYFLSETYLNDLNTAFTAPIGTIRGYLAEQSMVNTLTNIVTSVTSTLSMKLVVLGGVGSYFAPRAVAKAFGTEVGPIPQYCMLRMPMKLSGWLVGVFILAEVALYFGWESVAVPALMLESALSAVLSIQATTFICWLLSRKIKKYKLTVFLSVVIAIGLSLMGLLELVGLVDMLFKMRDRFLLIKKMKDRNNNNNNQ